MKPDRRRHPDRVLTAVQVRQIRKPGRHADGNGLYLLVEPSGARRWVLRTIVRALDKDLLDQAWREVLDDPHYMERRHYEERKRIEDQARVGAANR